MVRPSIIQTNRMRWAGRLCVCVRVCVYVANLISEEETTRAGCLPPGIVLALLSLRFERVEQRVPPTTNHPANDGTNWSLMC
jgi:hypothetical protein